jgi:hypothetical protein
MRARGGRQRLVHGDPARPDVVEERLIERLHPVVVALGDDLSQAAGLPRVHDGVLPDLALVDDRPLVRVEVLDGVLDGHDVLGLRGVDAVDHRRERRRLARARGAGDEDDAALLVGELPDHRRQTELLHGPDHVRDGPHDERHRAPLVGGVDAEAGEPGNPEGQVDLVLGLELGAQPVVAEKPVNKRTGDAGLERRRVRERPQEPVDPDHRRRGDLEVEVRALRLDEVAQGRLEVEHEGRIGVRHRRLERVAGASQRST